MNMISRALIGAAAVGTALLPVVAEAATRASQGTFASTASLPGFGRSADGEEAEGSSGIIIGVIAAAAVIGGIIILADQEDEGQSPGT